MRFEEIKPLSHCILCGDEHNHPLSSYCPTCRPKTPAINLLYIEQQARLAAEWADEVADVRQGSANISVIDELKRTLNAIAEAAHEAIEVEREQRTKVAP